MTEDTTSPSVDARLAALRAYLTRSIDPALAMDDGVVLLDALDPTDTAMVDRWVEEMSEERGRLRAEAEANAALLRAEQEAVQDLRAELRAAVRDRDAARQALTDAGITAERDATALGMRRLTAERDEAARLSHQFRNERDAAIRDRDIARMHLAEIAQILALDPVTTMASDVIAEVREMRTAATKAIDAAPLDRANREIRRLLAERAAAVMERDRARADLDARLVEHLRTDAEHRAEIDRLFEQVARSKEGA